MGKIQILVLNNGSSSIKFSLFANEHDERFPINRSAACILSGELSKIGSQDAVLKISPDQELGASSMESVEALTVEQAIKIVLEAIAIRKIEPDAVGYRVVHPGQNLHKHQRITPEVLKALQKAAEFAPLHGPETMELIDATMKRFPTIHHYACFDTVFHETLPEEAKTYPLPSKYRASGVRRYGFHGLSCESIVRQIRLDRPIVPKRMVIAHLGSGCSVTALVDGLSVDTTMGLTPTGGVVMGTRSGDLDPGLVLYLLRQQEGDTGQVIDKLETLLNLNSGIASLSGMANDMKAIRSAANQGDPEAALSVKVFTRSITKTIGGFFWLLGGLDAIVFTGGVGEHDFQTRAEILTGLESAGVELDSARNTVIGSLSTISAVTSKIEVLVLPALEDLVIALHVEEMYAVGRKLDH